MDPLELEIQILTKNSQGKWNVSTAKNLDDLVLSLKEFVEKEGVEVSSYSGIVKEVGPVVIDITNAQRLELPILIMDPETFECRLNEESAHYQYLIYGIKHKINENNYYFGEGAESRKNVVTSTDCISLVQLISRDGISEFHVYMRSSDLMNLLPVDIYGIAREIVMNYFESYPLEFNLHIYISNLHVYATENELRMRKESNK